MTKRPFTINHVAFAVPSIAKFVESQGVLYRDFERGEIIENESQRVNEMFLSDGKTRIELLEPKGADSPIDGFLRRNRNGGLVHLALDVDDLEAALEDVRASGGRVVVDPTPDPAFTGRIAFVYIGGILTELIERPSGTASTTAR